MLVFAKIFCIFTSKLGIKIFIMDSNLIYSEIVKTSKMLMFKEPFYGLMLISLNKELSNAVPTAGVSKPADNIKLKLSVNPEFWSKLSANHRTAVLKHELLHIGFFHLNMTDKYPDKKLLNVAADLEVNQYIDDSLKGEDWFGLEINNSPFKELNLEPKKGTDYYYKALQKEMNENPDGDLSKAMNGGDSGEEGEGGEGSESIGDSDKLGHGGWRDFEKLSEAEKKLVQKQIDHTLKEVAKEINKSKGRGYIPGEMKEYIDSLFEIKDPVIDWKSYLRRFAGTSQKIETKKTRYKENRRFSSNPALKIKPQKKTLVAVDTSGSVSEQDLIEFFNEINHIYKTGISVTVVECDTRIGKIWEFKGLKETLAVTGRGGTDFEPVMEYFSQHRKDYNNLIYLTDGECSAPQNAPLKPILWVHCSSARVINETLPGAKIKIVR